MERKAPDPVEEVPAKRSYGGVKATARTFLPQPDEVVAMTPPSFDVAAEKTSIPTPAATDQSSAGTSSPSDTSLASGDADRVSTRQVAPEKLSMEAV